MIGGTGMDLELNALDEVKQNELEETGMSEAEALEPQMLHIPEFGEVLVGGNPFEMADILDDNQGDNILNAQGDCGVVSVVNIARLCGIDCSEDNAIVKAVNMRLCNFSTEIDPADNGGTNVLQRQALLSEYGISSSAFTAEAFGPEQIAKMVDISTTAVRITASS